MNEAAGAAWRPVAAAADLVVGHVFHGQLLGQELAIWRANDGRVNVWENRCPHRGVRLSIGAARGDELQCAYHGWRFASGSAKCVRIPAHPTLQPSPTVRIQSFDVAEALGLIWTRLSPGDGAPEPPQPGAAAVLVLRAMPIAQACDIVQAALADFSISAEEGVTLRWFVQPVCAERCVVRGVLEVAAIRIDDGAWRRTTLRRHDVGLEALRRRVEAAG